MSGNRGRKPGKQISEHSDDEDFVSPPRKRKETDELSKMPEKKRKYEDKAQGLDDFLSDLHEEMFPPMKFSTQLNAPFKKLATTWDPTDQDRRLKKGTLSSDDYRDGYLSDEGDKLLRTVRERHESVSGKKGEIEKLEKRKAKGKGKDSFVGVPVETTYHGVDVQFRVDYTQSKSGEYEPHARFYVGSEDMSTSKLSKTAMAFSKQSPQRQQEFVQGFGGHESDDPSKSFQIGTQMRAVGRGSDAFGNTKGVFDGYMMSKPTTPESVSKLFVHPEFGTGSLGHQNFDATTKVAEFNAFNEIATGKRHTHSTNSGTVLESTPGIRKASAINAFGPIVNVTTSKKSQ